MSPGRIVSVVAFAALVAALVPGLAQAHVIARGDGNDTNGPLDLASIQVTTTLRTVGNTRGKSVFLIRTLHPFTPQELDGTDGFIEVIFHVDRVLRSRVFVFYQGGRLRAVERRGLDSGRRFPASRPDQRSVRFTIDNGYLGHPKSFDLAALSVWHGRPCSTRRPCVDSIPNHDRFIRNDFTGPTTRWTQVPEYSSNASSSLYIPVRFGVTDDKYGSGFKSWVLQRHTVGTPGWFMVAGASVGKTRATLAAEAKSGAFVNVLGEEGVTEDLRVIAMDKHGNRTISTTRRTTVPWDDRDPMFTYSASTQNDDVAHAFLGTTSGVAAGDTITFTTPLRAFHICVVGGPSLDPVDVDISEPGTDLLRFTEDASTMPRHAFCAPAHLPAGTEVTIRTASGETHPFVFDGLAIQPYPNAS